jgi:hypothetical protein
MGYLPPLYAPTMPSLCSSAFKSAMTPCPFRPLSVSRIIRLPDSHRLLGICRYNHSAGHLQSRNRTLVCRCYDHLTATDIPRSTMASRPTSGMSTSGISSQLPVSTKSPSGPSVVNPILGAVVAKPSLQRTTATASKAEKNHATAIRIRYCLAFWRGKRQRFCLYVQMPRSIPPMVGGREVLSDASGSWLSLARKYLFTFTFTFTTTQFADMSCCSGSLALDRVLSARFQPAAPGFHRNRNAGWPTGRGTFDIRRPSTRNT